MIMPLLKITFNGPYSYIHVCTICILVVIIELLSVFNDYVCIRINCWWELNLTWGPSIMYINNIRRRHIYINRIWIWYSNQFCSVCCSNRHVNKGVVNQRDVRIISKVINPGTGKSLDLRTARCVTLQKDAKMRSKVLSCYM